MENAITVDQTELRRVLGRMPYLPITTPGIVSPQDGHDLVRTLGGLADYLSDHAREIEDDARELASLKAERAVVRSYFGVTDNA